MGSSNRRISGCWTKASAIARRFFQPPDSAAVAISKSSNPARPSVSAVRDARSVSGTPDFLSAASITDESVSPGANSEICETQLSRCPCGRPFFPYRACTRPCKISRSVDLPEPLGPISPMRSPSETVNEIFWNSGAVPYRFESPCALIIGGKLFWSSPGISLPSKSSRGKTRRRVQRLEFRRLEWAGVRLDREIHARTSRCDRRTTNSRNRWGSLRPAPTREEARSLQSGRER